MKASLGFGLAQEKWTSSFLAGGRRRLWSQEALLTRAEGSCGSWGMRSVSEEAAFAFHLKEGPRSQGWVPVVPAG